MCTEDSPLCLLGCEGLIALTLSFSGLTLIPQPENTNSSLSTALHFPHRFFQERVAVGLNPVAENDVDFCGRLRCVHETSGLLEGRQKKERH